jgi:hypothetical protein
MGHFKSYQKLSEFQQMRIWDISIVIYSTVGAKTRFRARGTGRGPD